MNGDAGFIRVANTDQKNGLYCAIYVEADATFTILTSNIEGTMTGVAFLAGVWMYGRITVAKLTSGTIHLYKMDNPAI